MSVGVCDVCACNMYRWVLIIFVSMAHTCGIYTEPIQK